MQRPANDRLDMYSNLSKIQPKLRTQGNVTGNFGKAKVKAANNADLGFTKSESVGSLPTQEEYLRRLYTALDNTNDSRLLSFLQKEIRSIHIQRGTW